VRERLLGSFDALREREFRLLFTAHAISAVGDFLVPVALAFAVLDLTGSASDLGFVLTARLVPLVLFMLAGGVWADRLPRQRLMIASHLVRLVSQGGLGLLLVAGHARIWELVALQAVHGTATAFFRPASSGIVPQTVRPERLHQANGLMWGAIGVAGFAGPAIAGVVLATAGAGWAILGDATTFALGAYLLARLRLPPLERAPRERFLHELAVGWREVVSRRWLWTSIVSFAVFQLAVIAAFSVLGPVVAKRSLGGASAWATLAAAFGIGSIVGNFCALHLRPRRPLRFAFALTLLCFPSLFLLAVAAPVPLIAATELASGLAIGLSGAMWETTLQEHVPEAALSRVSAYDWMGSMVLRPAGLAAVGPIASVVGVKAALVGAGLMGVVSNLVLLGIREVRTLERGGPATAAGEPAFAGLDVTAEA
jgi:predicted MFS family arabinose efflux permease